MTRLFCRRSCPISWQKGMLCREPFHSPQRQGFAMSPELRLSANSLIAGDSPLLAVWALLVLCRSRQTLLSPLVHRPSIVTPTFFFREPVVRIAFDKEVFADQFCAKRSLSKAPCQQNLCQENLALCHEPQLSANSPDPVVAHSTFR